ncbi:pirin family protein [Telmatospirillum sp. J64-1]|uniref:pirin family protein n=1 Tax=Telmatospirillum sp. J64-1 TaxID=2502183 RepID=UPI00115E4995|nr:pirin family protein [Telmatospirillum sp. J64-1]
MIDHRPFESLGRFTNDWLNARYHFSFADYYDRNRMGWGVLRVWNDDQVRPHKGFPPHGHRDMEIITYVRRGAVSHEDGLGNKGRTIAGDVQVMSAGTGIMHAEYNREDEDTLLFQIWIIPDRAGHAPRWETRSFPKEPGSGLVPLASGRAEHKDALIIHQDAAILGGTLATGKTFEHPIKGRRAYLVAATGRIRVNGTELGPRDGAAIEDEDSIVIEALEDSEVVLADLP